MIDDVEERLEANATLSDVAIEQTNADDNIGQLAELGDLLRRREADEWAKTGTRQDGLKGGGDLTLNSVRNGGRQLNRAVVANDVLLILVEQVVEDLLVQDSDALEVVAGTRLKADDLIDESVALMTEVGDVLLALHLLLDVGRIVTDLKFNRVQTRGIDLI